MSSKTVERTPIRVAAANDYQLIIDGVAAMLAQFPDAIEVVECIVLGESVPEHPIDVVLYDTYGRIGLAEDALAHLIALPTVLHVAVFSLWFPEELVSDATAVGATGFISKALPAIETRDALLSIASGEFVVATHPKEGAAAPDALNWPGRAEGVSERESQVLVLAAEGLTNAEVADALYLSVDTVKTHMRNALAKLKLRNRVQAASFVARAGTFARYQPVDRAPSDEDLPRPQHGPPGALPSSHS